MTRMPLATHLYASSHSYGTKRRPAIVGRWPQIAWHASIQYYTIRVVKLSDLSICEGCRVSCRHRSTIRMKYSFVFVFMTTNCSLRQRVKPSPYQSASTDSRLNTNESINWSAFKADYFRRTILSFFFKSRKMIRIHSGIFNVCSLFNLTVLIF